MKKEKTIDKIFKICSCIMFISLFVVAGRIVDIMGDSRTRTVFIGKISGKEYGVLNSSIYLIGQKRILVNYSDLLESVPKRYKKGVRIYFVDSLDDSSLGGFYDNIENIVIINTEKPNNKIEEVIWHELGHHWWYERLTRKERKEFTKMYLLKKSHVTHYASIMLEEDFAEIFSCGFDKNSWKDNCSDLMIAEEIEFIERTVNIDIESEGTNSTEGRFISIKLNE